MTLEWLPNVLLNPAVQNNYNVKKILIVGSNGLLGSSLVRNFHNLFHIISGVNKIETTTAATNSLVEIDVVNFANVETVIAAEIPLAIAELIEEEYH